MMGGNPRSFEVGERVRQIEGQAVRILTLTRIPHIDDKVPYFEGFIGAAKKQVVTITTGQMAKWHRFEGKKMSVVDSLLERYVKTDADVALLNEARQEVADGE